MAARPAAGRTRGNIQAVTNVRLPVGVPGSLTVGPGWGGGDGFFHAESLTSGSEFRRLARAVICIVTVAAFRRPNRDIETAPMRRGGPHHMMILCQCMDTETWKSRSQPGV